ncbi:hypothetical protein BDL97_01G205100 [Sphagnum fallax]|nr:hypothetical protein BDL97_01G205100 [Sphagnum fallax]
MANCSHCFQSRFLVVPTLLMTSSSSKRIIRFGCFCFRGFVGYVLLRKSDFNDDVWGFGPSSRSSRISSGIEEVTTVVVVVVAVVAVVVVVEEEEVVIRFVEQVVLIVVIVGVVVVVVVVVMPFDGYRQDEEIVVIHAIIRSNKIGGGGARGTLVVAVGGFGRRFFYSLARGESGRIIGIFGDAGSFLLAYGRIRSSSLVGFFQSIRETLTRANVKGKKGKRREDRRKAAARVCLVFGSRGSGGVVGSWKGKRRRGRRRRRKRESKILASSGKEKVQC